MGNETSYKRESKAIPPFERKDANWWLTKVEQYFQALEVSEMEKLFWACLAMRGSALNWWYTGTAGKGKTQVQNGGILRRLFSRSFNQNWNLIYQSRFKTRKQKLIKIQ